MKSITHGIPVDMSATKSSSSESGSFFRIHTQNEDACSSDASSGILPESQGHSRKNCDTLPITKNTLDLSECDEDDSDENGESCKENTKLADNEQSGDSTCSFCGKVMKTKRSLADHLKIHTGEKPYECELCGKRCIQNVNLKSHMISHTSKKPYHCSMCDKYFKRKHHYTRHYQSMHSLDRWCFTCSECGKKFSRKDHFKEHMAIHSNESRIQCDKCDKTFKRKGTLNKHMRRRHDATLVSPVA